LVVEGFQTKRVVAILAALGLDGSSTLIVVEDVNATVEASSRNIPGVSVVRVEGVNVYDLLRHKSVLITKAAIEKLEARLGKDGGAS
jgi:large subunit ribosomal protein L4